MAARSLFSAMARSSATTDAPVPRVEYGRSAVVFGPRSASREGLLGNALTHDRPVSPTFARGMHATRMMCKQMDIFPEASRA
jgi:hypothetical protein